jgi:hypothetical protein
VTARGLPLASVDAERTVCEEARIIVWVLVSIVGVNVLAVVVTARLGRRLFGSAHHRPVADPRQTVPVLDADVNVGIASPATQQEEAEQCTYELSGSPE